MGFWHTGYIEFHEPAGIEEPVLDPPPVTYRCEHCDALFPTIDKLREHRFSLHPSIRPSLFIRGHEVGGQAVRITQPLTASDVHIIASSAYVNDNVIQPTELASLLTTKQSETIELRLSTDISVTFTLHFQIASERDLMGVESCFRTMANGRQLNRRVIEQFISASRSYSSAATYYNAICDFLYGIMAKEQHPDSSLPMDQYQDKFNRAMEALSDLTRPLARLIQSLIYFHYNHYTQAAILHASNRVTYVSRRYSSWIGRSTILPDFHPPSEYRDNERILTDRMTEHILTWASLQPAAVVARAPQIEHMLTTDICDLDRVKLRILLAESYACVGRTLDCQRHARELRNNPAMGGWAEAFFDGTYRRRL